MSRKLLPNVQNSEKVKIRLLGETSKKTIGGKLTAARFREIRSGVPGATRSRKQSITRAFAVWQRCTLVHNSRRARRIATNVKKSVIERAVESLPERSSEQAAISSWVSLLTAICLRLPAASDTFIISSGLLDLVAEVAREFVLGAI